MSCYCGEDQRYELDHPHHKKDKKHKIFTNPPHFLQEVLPICVFHPNQHITNFCINPECFMPLCPQCVEVHLDLHRLNNNNSDTFIKTFEHVRLHSLESVKGFLENLKNQKRDLERIGISPEALKMQLMKDLEASKGKVVNLVEDIFAELHKQLEREVFQASGFFNINDQMMEIKRRLHDLEKAFDKIHQGGQKALKEMILLNNNHVFPETAKFLEIVRGVERKVLSSDLRIHENVDELNNMAMSLKRFLNFTPNTPFTGITPVNTLPSMIRPPDEVFGAPRLAMSSMDPRSRRSFMPPQRIRVNSPPPEYRMVHSSMGYKPRWAEY